MQCTVLAAYNSRNRVIRAKDGTIHLSWGALGLSMPQGEFVGFVHLVTEAAGCALRCGELARGSWGRVAKCSMGQITLSHGTLTLWFSPEEFRVFCRLLVKAGQQLADAKPLPTLGLPWVPPNGGDFGIN